MRIDIRTIARDIGSSVEVHLQFSPSSLDMPEDEYQIIDVVQFDGKIDSMTDKAMILTGKLSGTLESYCDRCREPVAMAFDGQVEATFRPAVEIMTQETSLDPEEEYPYDGFYLILDKALRDSLIMCIPIKMLCDEDCKGLCMICGGNQNKKDCGCTSSGTDRLSAFDGLKKLL